MIDGKGGDDIIEGLGGDDKLYGNEGDDYLRGDAGEIDGGAGEFDWVAYTSRIQYRRLK